MIYRPMAPCPHCTRHVRVDERACPFCGDALGALAGGADTTARLGRAAAFAFGAMAVTACSGETVVDQPPRATAGAGGDGSSTSSAATGGGMGGAGGDAAGAGGAQPLYGGPPQGGMGGAGGDDMGAGGFQAEYGAPPPPDP